MVVNLHDFVSDSQLFNKIKVDNLLFVEYQCLSSDSEAEIWSHHNYMAFAIGGKKKWITQKNEYLLQSGDCIFVKKGAHTIYQYFEEKFLVLFIFIPDEFIKNVIEKYKISPVPGKKALYSDSVIPLSLDKMLTTYFYSLLHYFTQTEPPPKALLKLKLEELIINLIYNRQNAALIQYFNGLCISSKSSLKEIMETNFSKDLSLSEFARLCARSLSTFKRDFFNIYEMSPGKWLIEKRLDYSAYLLHTHDKTIEDIADESGFKNRSHFMKAFKNKFGITPHKFKTHRVSASNFLNHRTTFLNF